MEVKLLLIGPRPGSVAPAGHAILFAVGAGPPHDEVRRARRLNLFHDLAGVQPAGAGLFFGGGYFWLRFLQRREQEKLIADTSADLQEKASGRWLGRGCGNYGH